MIIKWMGVLLISSSCAGMGFFIAYKEKQELEQLKELYLILLQMKSRMSYQLDTLEYIFHYLSEEVSPPFKRWLDALYQNIVNQSEKRFETIWIEGVSSLQKDPDILLSEQDLNGIDKMGWIFVQVDKEYQQRNLEWTLTNLEKKIQLQECSLKGKQKIYRSMGMAVGLFLIILLA